MAYLFPPEHFLLECFGLYRSSWSHKLQYVVFLMILVLDCFQLLFVQYFWRSCRNIYFYFLTVFQWFADGVGNSKMFLLLASSEVCSNSSSVCGLSFMYNLYMLFDYCFFDNRVISSLAFGLQDVNHPFSFLQFLVFVIRDNFHNNRNFFYRFWVYIINTFSVQFNLKYFVQFI